MPQISAVCSQQLKATSAHPNRTLPGAPLLARDIWKASGGCRIPAPAATAQSTCLQRPATARRLPSQLHHAVRAPRQPGHGHRVRCLSTKCSTSSVQLQGEVSASLLLFSTPLRIQITRAAPGSPALGSSRFASELANRKQKSCKDWSK